MKNKPESTLKALNLKWHVGLATADAIVIAVFVSPELVTTATTTQLGIYRALSVAVIPIVVVLLVNVLPSNVKAMFVYWKPLGVLPGCEAFTKYGPADVRVDMVQLKKNVGAWSVGPREQNAKWFKLYKMVEDHAEVAGAQKDFLMYRDMAVLSIPLIVVAPLSLYAVGASPGSWWMAAAVFVVQYLLTATSARHSGERFVCNVLAVHSIRKVTTLKSASVA